MWQRIKYFVYGGLALVLIYNMCFKSEEELVEVPTKGLITTVKEVEKDQFKIEDEVPVENPDESLIIAKYMDERIDTFTLAEARLMESQGYSGSTTGSIMQAASFGFLGYMLGRSMMSRPNPGAYVNQGTYDRVNNSTGNTLRSTANRVSTKGRSGFGSGRSGRSFGG